MNECPIIEKIESQKAIQWHQRGVRTVEVIESVGIDTEGKRWRWLEDCWHQESAFSSGDDFYMIRCSSHPYGWQRL